MGWLLLLLAVAFAMSGDKPSTTTTDTPATTTDPPPPKKATSAAPSSVPAKLSEYFDNPANRDVGAEFAGWYTYRLGRGVDDMRWIRIDEYPASRSVTEVGVGTAATRYSGRFRWSVFMPDGEFLVGTAIVDAAGETIGIGFDPEARIADARNNAIDEAAEAAVEWIDAGRGAA